MAETPKCSVSMTLCPECVQHVRFCSAHDEVSCPFCETTFTPEQTAGTKPTGRLVSAKMKHRVMAASFVGATVLAPFAFGCPAQAEYGPAYPNEWEEPAADAGDTGDVGDASHTDDVNDDQGGDAGEDDQ
jgi:hypothetical protein